MLQSLPDYWDYISEQNDKIVRPASPSEARIADPFGRLPPALTPTPDSNTWLKADMYAPSSITSLYAYQRAAEMRGRPNKVHRLRRKRFKALRKELVRAGFTIPDAFARLINDDHIVNRLRFGCHWIEMPDFICPCPADERHVMLLFLCEAQGCNYTHLTLGPDGSHCITRTGHEYGQHASPPNVDSTVEEKRVYLYADSIEQFICWSADEIIQRELDMASDWLHRGDAIRDSGDREQALVAYNVGLTYDPSSHQLLDRVRTLNRG